MEFIRKRLDKIRKPFNKGEKFERFAPAVNAFDTFLFVPITQLSLVHIFVMRSI